MNNYDDPASRKRCFYCNVKEGQFHERWCDHELCPECQKSVSSYCDCMALFLGKYNKEKWLHTNGYEPHYYYNGASKEERDRYWSQQKRIPFIDWLPFRCRRCGKEEEKYNMQPDEVWEKYIIKTSHCQDLHNRGGIVCAPCFNIIKNFIDNP